MAAAGVKLKKEEIMEKLKIEVEYGGYQIKWDDHRRFVISKDGVVAVTRSTPEECQQFIDKKNRQSYRRVNVLASFGYMRSENLCPGEATSIVEGDFVWVVAGKERAKKRMSDVWIDSAENRNALELIKEKKEQILVLNKEIKGISEAATRLTAEMMVPAEGENNGQ